MEKKRITLTVILIVLAVLASYGQADFDNKLKSLYRNTVPLIHSEELSERLAENEILILDTRSLEEFQISHLPNALFMDYNTFDSKKVEGINRNSKIVVYCSVGYRSERIGENLLDMGFTDVRNLYGGIFDWVNHKNTVVNQAGIKTDSVHTYNKDWSRWLIRGVKVY